MLFATSTLAVTLFGILGLIIWIAIAFWPARVARRKGHSFIGYFILSLFFFPLALVMAYVVRDRRGLSVRA
jgi:ABC-type Mn2+/Zn2+ transport system permease subunit